jgi:phosphate transport system permease protein
MQAHLADRRELPARIILGLLAYTALLVLALVIGFLLLEAQPVLQWGLIWQFFTQAAWFPLEQRFGLMPMLAASLLATLGAVVLAAPLGVAVAIAGQFLVGARLAKLLAVAMGLLAGIPSVVFGLWGLTVLVPLIAAWQAPGTSVLAAIVVLSLMIIPTVALTSSAALAAVPASLLQGAAALGLSQSAMVLGVALPAARKGVVSGILLAVARALGETMAVLMVAGNVVQTPGSLFDSVRVLTANIALEMSYASGDHRAALFVSGLALVLAVLALTWASNER